MGTSTNRSCAETLAQAGVTIFPCHPGTRKPLVAWRSESSSDPAVVAKWWAHWPAALPALDLARCGLFVLDGDRHGKTDGVTALRQLLRQQNGVDLRALPMVRTPRDGVHVYFRQCAPVLTNRRGALPQGVDARGAGGFVLAPGAERPDGSGYHPIAGQPSSYGFPAWGYPARSERYRRPRPAARRPRPSPPTCSPANPA
jgi:Bifunctional DNA primase/polymerase, N-terminal